MNPPDQHHCRRGAAPRTASRARGRRVRFSSALPTALPLLLALAWEILPPAIVHAAAAPSLDWQPRAGWRTAELKVVPTNRVGFTLMSATATRLRFTNVLAEARGLTNQTYMNGSGLACGDVDGDGWCDLYFCGLDSPNRLYRNLGGWTFEDITASAGVGELRQASTGAVLADVDGDGDLDLLISGLGHGARLFLNDGRAHFREITGEAGLASQSAGMSMALGDIDGDGDLDLYLANYRTASIQDEVGIRLHIATTNGQRVITTINGRPVSPAERLRYSVGAGDSVIENGEADVLYRNDGHAHFTPVSWTDGSFLDEDGQALAAPPYDWGLAVMFRDMNGDGAPDIYVCNDNDSVDRVWINDGRGRFRAAARLALRQSSLASMGVDFADLNRDGLDEFVVVDMLARDPALRQRLMTTRRPLSPVGVFNNRPAYGCNTLFLNRGDGTYAEIAHLAGVDASDWSWAPAFLDVDLDGYEDLLVTTGLERSLRDADGRRHIDLLKAQQNLSTPQFQELRRTLPRLETPKHAFRNLGDLTFEEVSAQWGFDSRAIAQGMALADLDNDGDLDVISNVLNGPALVYRNDGAAPRVAVRLKGAPPNTRGIGAKLRFLGGPFESLRAGPVAQSQEMLAGGRYLSSDDPMRVFAAGSTHSGLSIEVTWRTGRRSVVREVPPNHVCEIDEAGAEPARASGVSTTNRAPSFRDVSDLLHHEHFERPFNDFERQLLLPRMFSHLGPGVCWADLNADGRDDLIVGAGLGGELGFFLNAGDHFDRISVGNVTGRLPGDATTVLSFPAAEGTALLVGASSYKTASTNDPSVLGYVVRAEGLSVLPPFSPNSSSVGPMALADVDGDGSLELFVGGRIVPGRYPEPASSVFYRQVEGRLEVDAERSGPLERIGLVSGAVFSDLDGDGFAELILACEWGPVRVFHNDHGAFRPWEWRVRVSGATTSLLAGAATLAELTGWWNSVTTGDFDNDGRMDIVVGNWGRNSKYQRYLARPLRLLYGDWRGDGEVQILEAFEDARQPRLLPWRRWDTLAQAVPKLGEQFGSFAAYSEAGVDDILGDRKRVMKELSAITLDSMLFLNRGDHFEVRPLPLEAQLSPAFGLSVGDLDGDGHEDLFVAQNFFGVDPETSRHDAGRGLWLKGDGHGTLTPVPASESGVMVYGEGRGTALSDYDGDGRVDLVVTQNGAATKLYHNERAKPGLRVRLSGPPGNRAGVGTVLRRVGNGRAGPAREVHAGSGYWSQDSAVQVLAWPAGARQLQLRWPGGKPLTTAVPEDAKVISVDVDGGVTAVR